MLLVSIMIVTLSLGGGFLAFGDTTLDPILNQEIDNLNAQIKNQKQQINELQERQKAYKEAIAQKQNEKATLSSQLSILESRIAKAEIEIESAKLEITQTDLEIRKTEIEINNINQEIEQEMDHMATLLKMVYKQNQVSPLEALLLNDSLSEFLAQIKYLENTNEEVNKSVDKLKENKLAMDGKKADLNDKRKQLVELNKSLEEKKANLEYEQGNKAFILEETRESEAEYQSLLAKAKREQAQVEAEITSLETTIRQKLAASQKDKLESGDSTLAWPVTKNTITSTFHDPEYPYRNIIGEHSAIDIRAKQGTTLKAAADGYVAKVKFDGTSNYAYIMIIHADNISTVYGHVSAVNVKQDDYVVKGQVIGKTGGMPGGIGSGPFVTGPHLHFEVRKNGIPVNPLEYLP